jgi:hypothetical protein
MMYTRTDLNPVPILPMLDAGGAAAIINGLSTAEMLDRILSSDKVTSMNTTWSPYLQSEQSR